MNSAGLEADAVHTGCIGGGGGGDASGHGVLPLRSCLETIGSDPQREREREREREGER